MRMSTIRVDANTSAITLQNGRWLGRVTFSSNGADATARWVGRQGSDMGELCDVEGDEVLCETIEQSADVIESRLTDALGTPQADALDCGILTLDIPARAA